MTSHVLLRADDLAALIERGLQDRVRGVTCGRHGAGFRVRLAGLEAHAKLPRCDVVLDIALAIEHERLVVRFRVAPTTWSAWVLVPGQRLGGGRMVVEPLIDRLGLRPAVCAVSDQQLVLDPTHIPGLARMGLQMQMVAVADEPEPGLVLTFAISRSE